MLCLCFINFVSFILDEIFRDPGKALQHYRKENKSDEAPQRIYVDRFQNGLESDILGLYKSPNFNLRVEPRVRFESEPAVGVGPVREFFCLALQLLENGLTDSNQGRVVLFEGSQDHKLPVVNNLMKQAGLYVTVGKILAHSILHGGPPYYGLSPIVIHYWREGDVEGHPLPLCTEDIPDYELRTVLDEVSIPYIQ